MPDPVPSLAAMVRQALARDPSRQAIEFEGQWHCWGALSDQASDISAWLSRCGAGPMAPVAFVPRNHPSSIAALLALLAEGRTVRMIYAFQSAQAIARDINRLEPSAVILDHSDLAPPIVEAMTEQGVAGLTLSASECKPVDGADRTMGAAANRYGPVEPQIEILTSGTTGPPKQFPIDHRMIAESLIGSAALTDQAQANAAALPPGLLYFPLGNISGIYSTVPALIRGHRVCLLDRFSLEAWHVYIQRHRPAHSGIPPASMRALLDADIPPADLASLRTMGIGAAPLDPELQRAFEDRYGIPILLSYGATEFGGPVCAWTAELHSEWGRRKLGSVGKPIGGASLRIIDPASGAKCRAGVEGQLQVISPRIGPHWIKTADIAVIDEDGFLFLRGRADGAIMRGGFKILPETIERVLRAHVAVADVAVVAVPDNRLGEVPGAAICLRSGVDSAIRPELEAKLRQQLPATHIPVLWHFCDSLPCNASMKIDRPAITRLFRTSDQS